MREFRKKTHNRRSVRTMERNVFILVGDGSGDRGKRKMKRIALVSIGVFLGVFATGVVFAQSLAGTYSHSGNGVTLTLVLNQDGEGNLTGTMSSTTGALFQVEGMVQEGVGVGICAGEEGAVFFEASPQGNNLQFAMIEPDANNMPDYNRARQVLFVKQRGGTKSRVKPPQSTAPDSTARAEPKTDGPSAPSKGEVGNSQWGFAFRPPKGWKYKHTGEGVLLGHDTVPGKIVVFPHASASLQEVKTSMEEGLIEEGITMNLVGQLRKIGSNVFSGEYRGMWEGQQARGRGFGTYSPYGGGAMIVAVTTPDQYGPKLSNPAEQIAKGMRYFKVEVSDLMQNFAGYWWYYSGTSSISHENILYLAPDGSYRDRREDSANVSNLDQYGNVTSQYLGNAQDRNRGRWTVRGNKSEGVISVTKMDGSSFDLQYRVKPSNNQNFRAYYFNGKLYHWMTPEKLRMLGY